MASNSTQTNVATTKKDNTSRISLNRGARLNKTEPTNQENFNKPTKKLKQSNHDDKNSKIEHPPIGFIKLGELDDDDAASDVSTENFSTGERVLLDGKTKAQVAYFGPVHFSHDDDWVGVVFEEPIGKHNGTVADEQYFKCESMHGLFVRSHRLQRTDSSGHITARVKSPYRLRPKSSASMRSQDLEVEDVFGKAEQTDPLGFYEARAGTVRSPDQHDAINSKLGRFVEEIGDGDQVNYASPWIHSSRTPTPTHKQMRTTTSSLPAKRLAPSLAKKVSTMNKSKPYGIAFGQGEMDHY